MAGYKAGIEYIAENDEPTILEAEAMEGFATVHLLCVLFKKDSDKVASDVVAFRKKKLKEEVGHV